MAGHLGDILRELRSPYGLGRRPAPIAAVLGFRRLRNDCAIEMEGGLEDFARSESANLMQTLITCAIGGLQATGLATIEAVLDMGTRGSCLARPPAQLRVQLAQIRS